MFCFSIGIVAMVCGVYLSYWHSIRGHSAETLLFKGVHYVRSVRLSPRSVKIHCLTVDLKAPGLSFSVTATNEERINYMRAMTVGRFVEQSGVQIGINANFFQPFYSKTPWDYYPRTGDWVEVLGIAASSGTLISTHQWNGATIHISQSNEVQLGGTVSSVWNAIAGDQWLIRGAVVVAKPDAFGPYPRCGLGLSEDRRYLIVAAVDGKQPGFSEGMTLPEFAELLREKGAYDAINLDGGGSVAIAAKHPGGEATSLNSPIHTRIPGRQRPVPVHLGIRAEPVGEPTYHAQ